MEVVARTNRAQVPRAASFRQCDQQPPVRMRPVRTSYGKLSKSKSRSSLPLLTDSQRAVVRWPSLNSVQQPYRRRESKIDECQAVLDTCDFLNQLGERGAPEGKEDSASFTSSKEDLNTKCLPGLSPLASSSAIIINPWVSHLEVKLRSVVEDRLARRFRLALPLPPWDVVAKNPPKDGGLSPSEVVENSCRVFLNWTDNCDAVNLEITETSLKIGSCSPIRWEDLERVEVYRDSGMLFLNHFPVCVPERASFLHLCSKIAYRLRKIGRELSVFHAVDSGAPKFSGTSYAKHLPSLTSRVRRSKPTLTLRCAWKSLKARSGDKWHRGVFELADGDGEIYLSESLHKIPSLVLSHPKRPADVRLVAVDSKVGDELAGFSTGNNAVKMAIRFGVEVFVIVESPEWLVELLQETCSRRQRLSQALNVMTEEERAVIQLKKRRLEISTCSTSFSVDFGDVCAVHVDDAVPTVCIVGFRNDGSNDLPKLILTFPGPHERNAFIRLLRQSTDFKEQADFLRADFTDCLPASRIFGALPA